MTEIKVEAKKATPTQLASMLDYVEANAVLRYGKVFSADKNKIWKRIAIKLNELPGPSKTPDAWKVSFTIWKSLVRRRIRENQKLNKLDQRCAKIISLKPGEGMDQLPDPKLLFPVAGESEEDDSEPKFEFFMAQKAAEKAARKAAQKAVESEEDDVPPRFEFVEPEIQLAEPPLAEVKIEPPAQEEEASSSSSSTNGLIDGIVHELTESSSSSATLKLADSIFALANAINNAADAYRSGQK